MEIIEYSDRSIAVVGDTKSVKDQLKELGGKYIPQLKDKTNPDIRFAGWVFSNNKREQVEEFINSVNEVPTLSNNNKHDILSHDVGTGKTGRPVILPKSKPIVIIPKTKLETTLNNINYPNNFTASDGVSYQIIIQTCPLPKLDQIVTLKYQGQNYEYRVTKFNVNNPITDIELLSLADQSTVARAVVLNGKWQLFAALENHEFVF